MILKKDKHNFTSKDWRNIELKINIKTYSLSKVKYFIYVLFWEILYDFERKTNVIFLSKNTKIFKNQ